MGPHKTNARGFHCLGEEGILGKKSVAGMDGVRARFLSRCNDVVHNQIAFVARCRTHTNRFIRCAHKRGMGVGFAVNSNGGKAHFTGCAQHAQGNFASVGDQQLGDGAVLGTHV